MKIVTDQSIAQSIATVVMDAGLAPEGVAVIIIAAENGDEANAMNTLATSLTESVRKGFASQVLGDILTAHPDAE